MLLGLVLVSLYHLDHKLGSPIHELGLCIDRCAQINIFVLFSMFHIVAKIFRASPTW